MTRVLVRFVLEEIDTETVEVADEYSEGDLHDALRTARPFDTIGEILDYEDADDD